MKSKNDIKWMVTKLTIGLSFISTLFNENWVPAIQTNRSLYILAVKVQTNTAIKISCLTLVIPTIPLCAQQRSYTHSHPSLSLSLVENCIDMWITHSIAGIALTSVLYYINVYLISLIQPKLSQQFNDKFHFVLRLANPLYWQKLIALKSSKSDGSSYLFLISNLMNFSNPIQYSCPIFRTHTCIHTNPYRNVNVPSYWSVFTAQPPPSVFISQKQYGLLQHQKFNTINTTQFFRLWFSVFLYIFGKFWLKFDSKEEPLIKMFVFSILHFVQNYYESLYWMSLFRTYFWKCLQ